MHDSRRLSGYIKERVTGDDMWYVFLDEVQMCRGLESVLNGLNRRENLDIYVTGSNSKFLSTDVLTEFRGCGDNCMAALVNILASAVGSLTNPLKLANTFGSNGMHVSDKTIGIYIGYLLDAFFISKSQRYDIKGKRYIASPFKHYFTDMRLRNAQLNFRQQEENHIMENIIYNELLIRGFNVDVGVVEHSERNENGKVVRRRLEVDFVCNRGNQRYYIQSAFAIPDSSKMQQEQKSLVHIGDSFKKIIVVRDRIKLWRNEEGIVVMGIMDFLLNPNSLEL